MIAARAMRRHAESGFSLVELAVVTLIISIFLTIGLSAMNAVRENTALSATNAKQAAIKEVLIGYLRRNSRLPCPDTEPVALAAPDGIENRATAGNPATACSSTFGTIPYVTLGISRDAAQDGWGNLFSYHISNTAGANTDWTITANFRLGNNGVITVNDRTSDAAAPTTISTTIAAVIVSHGPNGFGAYKIGGTRNALAAVGTDERNNTDGDTTYYRRSTTTDDASWPTKGAFDDVVLSLTQDDLLAPLFKDGSIKSPTGEVNDAFYKIKTALIGYALGNPSANGNAACNSGAAATKCRFFPTADTSNGMQEAGNYDLLLPYIDVSLNQTDAIDPWGKRYRYQICRNLSDTTVGTHGISSALPIACGAGTTYPTGLRIISEGPDRTFGTTDDIAISVSIGELRGALSAAIP